MVHWDEVGDLHETILAMASPLTRYINEHIKRPNEDMITQIWTEAFKLDWKGDIKSLPKFRRDSNKMYPYQFIQSRYMYHKCKEDLKFADEAHSYPNSYNVMPVPIHDDLIIPGDKAGSMEEVLRFGSRNILGYSRLLEYKKSIPNILVAPMKNMWLDELCDFLKYPVALARAAIAGGHVQFLDYLVTKENIDLSRLRHINAESLTLALDCAAANGHFEMVKYLHANGTAHCSSKAIDSAAGQGYLHVIQWLHENRAEGCTYRAAQAAIQNDHIEVLKYLRSSGLAKNLNFATNYAKSYEMIKYLYEECGVAAVAMDNVAKAGDIKAVKYLHIHCHIGWSTKAMDKAAAHGHLEVVRFLHENRMEGCTVNAMNEAAAKGHLEVVKYLHENRTEGCSVNAMDGAAENGHLDIVKFLHANRIEGCTTRALDVAASNGYLNIVKFLHENRTEGCTTKAIDGAAENGHLQIVRFLYQNRTEGCTARILRLVAQNEQWDILMFLLHIRIGNCTKYTMDKVIACGQLEILKYMHENRIGQCTEYAIDDAAANGHFEVVKYLVENCITTYTPLTIEYASRTGHEQIVNYLETQRAKSVMSNRKRKHGAESIGDVSTNYID